MKIPAFIIATLLFAHIAIAERPVFVGNEPGISVMFGKLQDGTCLYLTNSVGKFHVWFYHQGSTDSNVARDTFNNLRTQNIIVPVLRSDCPAHQVWKESQRSGTSTLGFSNSTSPYANAVISVASGLGYIDEAAIEYAPNAPNSAASFLASSTLLLATLILLSGL
jgi:hypothetical protein